MSLQHMKIITSSKLVVFILYLSIAVIMFSHGIARAGEKSMIGSSTSQAEFQVAEVVVKMRRPTSHLVDSGSQALSAEEIAELSHAAGLPLTAIRLNRDGSQILRLPSPIRTQDARMLVDALRMLPDVLYAESLISPQTGTLSTQSTKGESTAQERVSQIVVKLRDPQSWAQAAKNIPLETATVNELGRIVGITFSDQRPMSGGAYILTLPTALPLEEAAAITQRLEASPLVEYADPVTRMRPRLIPNDPYYSYQWHYFEPQGGVNLPLAWNVTTGSPAIVVAVVDTGILPGHPDLAGRVLPGYDMISSATDARDGNGRDADASDSGDWSGADECGSGESASPSSWHGTHVAGTIGATAANSSGVAGVNWQSFILPVRVLGKCGGTLADIVDGLRWAVGKSVPGIPVNPYPAKVINLSLSGAPAACPSAYQIAINDVLATGATVVVAAGNEGSDAALYPPGNCAGVITVHATNRAGGDTPYSNIGQVVDISAPGGQGPASNGPLGNLPYGAVFSTVGSGSTVPTGHNYAFYSGTSMAAPHVSGIASLLLSLNPSLTPAQVMATISATARSFPVGTGSDCNQLYYCSPGIANAAAALNAVPSLTVPDFDGGGRSDMVFRHSSTGALTVWLLNGGTITASESPGTPGPSWHVTAIGDLNADGRSDMIFRHTSGTIAAWLMHGTKVMSASVLGSIDPAWQIVRAADLNVDGMADLILRHTGGTTAVWLMNGTTIMSAAVLGNLGTDWQVVGAGDTNGDRRADIILRHTNGTVAIWLMNGTVVIGASVLGALDPAWTIIGMGDFNSDRRADIVLHHTNGTVAIWLMNGTAIIGAGVPGNPGTGWQVAGVGDVNGDTLWDLVLRHTTGTVATWLMNGTAVASASTPGTLDPTWQIVGMH